MVALVFVAVLGFSLVARRELLCSCGGQASHCGGIFCCGAQALGIRIPGAAICGHNSRDTRPRPHPTPKEAGKYSLATDAQEAKEIEMMNVECSLPQEQRKFYCV